MRIEPPFGVIGSTYTIKIHPGFLCETHGTVTTVIDLTINHERFVFCLLCALEALERIIGQVQEIEPEPAKE